MIFNGTDFLRGVGCFLFMDIAKKWIVGSVDGVGGGRGVFATENISLGELILVEEPFLSIQDVFKGGTSSVDESISLHVRIAIFILQNGFDSDKHKRMFAELHPVTLTEELVKTGEEQHSASVDKILSHVKDVKRNDALRTLLAVQFNCFSSGMYFSQAMINHCCLPNCNKVCFDEEGKASFIFATKDISKGEEITITYCGILERSHSYRKKLLLEQHWFDVGVSPFPGLLDKIENQEDAKKVLEIELAMDQNTDDTFEKACLYLKQFSELVPEDHLCVMRAHAELVKAGSTFLQSQQKRREDGKDIQIAMSCLKSALVLKQKLALYLNTNHSQIGDACEDIELLLGFLMSSNPQSYLYKEFEEFGSYSAASRAQYEAKKRKDSIRKLFNSFNLND